MKTKLDNRLSDIFNMIDDSYVEIWDTCCDHGKLGLALLEANKANKIHFLDQVPSIIENLERKINAIPEIDTSKLELHLSPAQDIVLSNTKSLICICGVGGDVAIDIIKKICKNNPQKEYNFLVAAQYQLYDLRCFLIEEGFKSLDEIFTYEGKWNYEVLHISKNEGAEIDSIGANLFKDMSERKRKYLEGIVEHYERKSRGDQSYQPPLELYSKLF